MEDGIFGDRFRRRKSGGRRSSILKTKTPLLDLDPNQPIAESVVPRKKARISEARRVSFAETYQVKEFFRDSPQWIPDPEAEDDSSPELENLPDVPLHSSRSEIQGLDKLLTCPIQNNSSAEQNDLEEIPQLEENAPVTQNGSNHTILQEDTMDITDCLDQSNMIENLTKPLVEDFGTTFGDGKAFTTNLQKSSTESFSDKLFLPEKNFSRDDYKNHYNLDKESDFKTIVNTSINKYSIINASQTTVAGVAQTSMTTSITQRKPLTSINESMVFKPVVVERCNIVDIQDNLTGTVDGLSFLKQLNSTKSSSVFLEDHTVMFDGYDMEETEVLTKNIQYNDEKGSFILETDKIHSSLVSSQSFKSNNLAGTVDGSPFLKQLKSTKSKSVFKEDHTVMFDCYDMEETEVLTRNIQYNEEKGALVLETDKIHSGQVSSQSSKRDNNKTVFFGNDNDIEETKVITSDVDIYSNVETNGKEESKVLTSGVEFGASINAMNYKTIFFKSDDLEQTKAFTGKLDLGTCVPENKTMLYKDDEMEQTKALTGKLELGTSVPEKSILYKNYEMEQTKAFTGKLDLGTSVPEKSILFKNDEMEQTKAFTGKLDLGTTITEKSILFKNNEMEQTKAFTGKLDLGTSIPEKSVLLQNDKMEQKKAVTGKLELGTSIPKNKTVLYKDDEMEQTKALTRKLDFWGKDMELTSAKHGTENEFIKNKYKKNCALIQMIQKRHQDEIDIANDTTGVEDQNSSKAVANEIDNKKSVNNLELRRGGMSGIIAKLRQDMGTDDCEFTENLEITENNFDISATGNLTDKNNVCKKEYLEDLKSLEILNDKKTSNLKRQDVGTSGCEFTENFDSKRLKLGNAQELRGVSSIIAKFRRDMRTDDYEFTEDHFDITETGKIIDVNIKSKITYSDDLNNLEILDDNKTSNIKVDNQYLTGMMERMEKNPSRSFGLQTRTPMGKLFGNTREAFSERQPLTRGSTVKLIDRAALTECKTAQDHKQHQALTCSKALFSNHECPMNDEGEIRISPLPQLESCMNVTVGDRSCCQRSGKSNESFPVLELGGNDIVTGISDEQLPAELLSNSTMRSGHLDSTASSHCADINLTSCSVAQSIIESQMDHDLMKQIEDGEGPMSVQTFCRKMQMALPSWLKEGKLLNPRHSIATLTKVEKDTVRGKLEAKYIHEPYYDVYSAVNEQAQMRITNCKERIEEFNEHIKEQQPAIFDIAVNGSQELKDETREKLRVLAKCCTKEVKRQWKIMKLECHEQFYKRIVESRDVLSDEVDELVQASETVQQQITSLSNVTSNIDEMISELEQKPLPSQEDVKFLKTSQQEILQKTQALESINTTQKELEREKEELEKEKSNLEKEEMALKEEEATNEQSTLKMEINELKEKLDTLESLIEWCIDDWQDNFINFLFYDGSMQLTINKQQEPDNGRTKITSAHVQSLLDGDAKPSVKLIHSIILKRINEVSLLQSYSYTSELPQILHALSRIVLDARNLKTQINSISIKYLVSVYEDFIKVEKWSLKTLRKVDIKFTFSLEDLSVHILPDVTVTMGCIRPEDVLEQLNSISKGQDYLIRLCDTVNLDILSSVQKIS